jgi:hypothetical protein
MEVRILSMKAVPSRPILFTPFIPQAYPTLVALLGPTIGRLFPIFTDVCSPMVPLLDMRKALEVHLLILPTPPQMMRKVSPTLVSLRNG